MIRPDQLARDSLRQLIAYVFAHRTGPISGLSYEDLAFRIGRLNKHGRGHGHGLGQVLGIMGHLLQGIEGEWGERIPHIQSLVVNKTGPLRGLPDEGIKEFWPEYPRLSRAEKQNKVRTEHQRIVTFGSRWNDVLTKLGLPKVESGTTPIPGNTTNGGRGGGGIESEEHKALKAYVQCHPQLVGIEASAEAISEYPFPSLDEADVLFKTDTTWTAVEVKSVISDRCPGDYERGIYQVVKYVSLLEAMKKDQRFNVPNKVECVLVLESRLPDDLRPLVSRLGIRVLEKISPSA